MPKQLMTLLFLSFFVYQPAFSVNSLQLQKQETATVDTRTAKQQRKIDRKIEKLTKKIERRKQRQSKRKSNRILIGILLVIALLAVILLSLALLTIVSLYFRDKELPDSTGTVLLILGGFIASIFLLRYLGKKNKELKAKD